jgi:hypothetical protein
MTPCTRDAPSREVLSTIRTLAVDADGKLRNVVRLALLTPPGLVSSPSAHWVQNATVVATISVRRIAWVYAKSHISSPPALPNRGPRRFFPSVPPQRA